MKPKNQSRRNFVRTAAYVAPAILTLTVLPAHQAVGSARYQESRPHPTSSTPLSGK
jgi:hypothetical protein